MKMKSLGQAFRLIVGFSLILTFLLSVYSSGAQATTDRDNFGVPKLYATKPNGREWYLGNAKVFDSQWSPESSPSAFSVVAPGVFQTSGQVRMNIRSPSGKAWWRDVEMTAYLRYVAKSGGTNPHWEFFGRGERHSHNSTTVSQINGGVLAPAGTATWPWYGYALDHLSSQMIPACLGTAYHANLYVKGNNHDGQSWFEKEISHTAGYSSPAASRDTGLTPSNHHWFGMKVIFRNTPTNGVRLEQWIDKYANGNFVLVNAYNDLGAWSVPSTTLDNCSLYPYSYRPTTVLNWAAPWVTFRSDDMAMQFKWLSVREIGAM